MVVVSLTTTVLLAQEHRTEPSKKRLDFAKTYFEYGGIYMPSFQSKRLVNNDLVAYEQSASIGQYLTWGAFHFWGHAEFFVNIPLNHNLLEKDKTFGFSLFNSVATGARYYPLKMKENALRPYVEAGWAGSDFQQNEEGGDEPVLSKDFSLNVAAGVLYSYKSLGFRLGLNYFTDNKWMYPLSRTVKAEVETPPLGVQFGVHYAFDSSKRTKHDEVESWNEFPTVSKLSFNASDFGDFFIAAAPSSSYSLKASEYNRSQLPYLKEKMISKVHADIGVGYQFNRANMFAVASFRNPTFETKGFGTTQRIKKNSIALEVNKYITDYTGFAPYIGLNVAYDHIRYSETDEVLGKSREMIVSNKIEPGLTVGWDIVPGKTSEAFILRTNLRWYPFSKFEIDNTEFDFSQLEYNLIQLVFYPDRFLKTQKSKLL